MPRRLLPEPSRDVRECRRRRPRAASVARACHRCRGACAAPSCSWHTRISWHFDCSRPLAAPCDHSYVLTPRTVLTPAVAVTLALTRCVYSGYDSSVLALIHARARALARELCLLRSLLREPACGAPRTYTWGSANLHVGFREPTCGVPRTCRPRTYMSGSANLHVGFREPTCGVPRTHMWVSANLHMRFCDATCVVKIAPCTLHLTLTLFLSTRLHFLHVALYSLRGLRSGGEGGWADCSRPLADPCDYSYVVAPRVVKTLAVAVTLALTRCSYSGNYSCDLALIHARTRALARDR